MELDQHFTWRRNGLHDKRSWHCRGIPTPNATRWTIYYTRGKVWDKTLSLFPRRGPLAHLWYRLGAGLLLGRVIISKETPDCLSDLVPLVRFGQGEKGWRGTHTSSNGCLSSLQSMNMTLYTTTTANSQYPAPQPPWSLSHTCNCRQLRQLNHLVPSWPLRNVRHPPLVPLLKMQLLLLGELGEVWRPHLFQAGGTRY